MLHKPSPPSGGTRWPRLAVSWCCALSLLMLSACAAPRTPEPPVIARKPKATPLPAEISQIDVRPSTASLQPALEWSRRSVEILSGETPK